MRRDASGRERILDAALGLFAKKGFNATGVKEITKAAGVASGLLFYHFKTKSEILDALIRTRGIDIVFDDVATSGTESDPHTAVQMVCAKLLSELRNQHQLLRVVFTSWLDGNDASDNLPRIANKAQRKMSEFLASTLSMSQTESNTMAEFMFSSLVLHALLSDKRSDRTFVEGLSAILAKD